MGAESTSRAVGITEVVAGTTARWCNGAWMLFVREYGRSGPPVIVLHGGPGAPGQMAPVARGLAPTCHVIEPFQRGSGGERLTVARHVADLQEVISFYAAPSRPALLGSSWGAMLALAHAAAHPNSIGPLILVGCGTFDLVARSAMHEAIAERINDEIRARLKCADQLTDLDERLRASAEATASIYSYDPVTIPCDEHKVDARAQQETWDDMLRLQAEGIYPAAFATIKVPVLMVHGLFDPHPGRMILESLKPHLPQLEYRELDRCGHYPWLEKAATDSFFFLVRGWLSAHLNQLSASARCGFTHR